jgi:hypothetical protein
MLKFAAIFAVAVALCGAGWVKAQSPPFVPTASGTTLAVQGLPVSLAQFNAADGLGRFAPFALTSAQIGASTGDFVFIGTNSNSAKSREYNVVWNFTSSEASTIRAWAAALPLRSQMTVKFTLTWDASGRFPIRTADWTFVYDSLLPYTVNAATCNLTANVLASRVSLAQLPLSCSAVLIPGQKAQLIAQPGCLGYFAEVGQQLHVACLTVRAFLETVYCSDGASGVELACNYARDILPTGIADAANPTGAAIAIGADGLPTAGRRNGPTTTTPSPARASASLTASAAVAVVAMLVATLI